MTPSRPGLALAADIGGTNARFAAFVVRSGADAGLGDPVWERTWPSTSIGGPTPLLGEVLGAMPGPVACAGVAVAGPVVDGVCRATNLPWAVDAAELARALDLPHVALLNDLEAHAHGLACVPDDRFLTVAPGRAGAHGNRTLLSAGTGLGEAGLVLHEGRHVPFACEGGHATFAPSDDLQDELAAHLRVKFGHVSWERVLSGPGIENLYDFLRARERAEDVAEIVVGRAKGALAPAVTAAALAGTSDLAVRTLDLFLSLYGAAAGGVALHHLATGGVYLGGGISARLAPWFLRGGFRKAFLGQGRMRPLLEPIPVRVVLETRTALFGAARVAMGLDRASPAGERP